MYTCVHFRIVNYVLNHIHFVMYLITYIYSSSWKAIIVCLYSVDFVLRVYVHISLRNTICLALIIVE